MDLGITNEQAKQLVDKYITDDITHMHLLESEAIMRALAKHFNEDEEQWGIIGLLHDIDWDITKNDEKEHGNKMPKILRESGGTDYLIETIESHIYGHSLNERFKSKQRQGKLQHSLAAAETVTGLIVAAALVQPDKKLSSVKLSSLKKKFKQKAFAAGCNREIIRECEKIGLTLDEFLQISLNAMQSIAKDIGL
jgi:putative nucleotidyltransferase with HDIG domain